MTLKSKRMIFGILMVLALVALMSLPLLPNLWRGQSYGQALDLPAPNFKLYTTRGDAVTLSDIPGVKVVYFGYINCDGVCQTQLTTLFHLAQAAGDVDFKILFITLDPQRDTPKVLDEYINALGSRFLALRGEDMPSTQALAYAYGVPYAKTQGNIPGMEKNTSENYDLQHPAVLTLVDNNQKIRMRWSGTHLRYPNILQDIAHIAAQSPSH